MSQAKLADAIGAIAVLHVVLLSACQDRVRLHDAGPAKPVIVRSFDEISPGGMTRIENTCRELKAAMGGDQAPEVCLEVAVSSRLMSYLCGHIDGGLDECLPLLRLKDGKATLETPHVTYMVTQLQRIYP